MGTREESIRLSLTAMKAYGSPSQIDKALRESGREGLKEAFAELDYAAQEEILKKTEELVGGGIGVVMRDDPHYPQTLINNGRSVAPVLYYWGNPDLLLAEGIGMCGSRSASDLGLKAAHDCGEEVSSRYMSVISGYAKGVDTATHLAALRSGGSTVVVLAEGFDHFRIKREFKQSFDPARILVLSQFAPAQPWRAYAAMARNKVIFGLGRALVVVEAGERGGTLAAGEGALQIGRPVLVLNFGSDTPPGNRILIERGGFPIGSREELGRVLDKRPAVAIQESLPI
ncbi:DNA-processing protein DprA [Actinacidiphila epipremni]|uniref:Smf/DprA SLOG domain-containing protein n=1 Tax=Actinacidiphila epipremni TaxID=2053013 RepID=A0ABX0ZRU0_9ACTN|nr:DNA-processing protein DprA [Actinacidiphila epipremni]NJP44474.1 hypothetical protein [Actinacidiphila epipremni]